MPESARASDASTGVLPVQSTQPDGVKTADTVGDQAAADTSTTATAKLTDIEELAAEMGWSPDKSTLGDAWVDAKTFIKRTRDIQTTQSRTIREQSRKIDRVLTTAKSLEAHYDRVLAARQAEFDEKIETLKKERDAAIVENDPAKVRALDTRIDAIKDAKTKDANAAAANAAAAAEPQPDALLDEWVSQNPWYKEDATLRAYAHTRAKIYGLSEISDDAEYQATLNIITGEVKERYPDKFGKVARTKGPAGGVEGVGNTSTARTGAPTKTFTRASLSEEQRKVYDSYVEMGISGQKIIEGWVTTGELA